MAAKQRRTPALLQPPPPSLPLFPPPPFIFFSRLFRAYFFPLFLPSTFLRQSRPIFKGGKNSSAIARLKRRGSVRNAPKSDRRFILRVFRNRRCLSVERESLENFFLEIFKRSTVVRNIAVSWLRHFFENFSLRLRFSKVLLIAAEVAIAANRY